MSDEGPEHTAQPHQPNWGSAYPPPGPATPPPASGYPPPPYPPPGYAYPYAPQPPKHAGATTAMVLGIVAVGGGLMCYLPLFVAPFAWFQGHRAMREIDESRGQLSGRGEAKAGFVLGIIGTVILALALAVIALFIVLTLTVDDFWDDDYDSYAILPAVRSLFGG